MVDTGFTFPAPFVFNKDGSTKEIFDDYSKIFTHTAKTDCPLTTCKLKAKGCASELETQTNVVLG
jgi:hypothetical protein